MLDDANDAMRELRSVTVVADTVRTDGDGFSSRFTTDLRSRCTSKVTWKETGATLEQIRIGETDYVRPNRAYVEQWSGKAMNRPQNTWLKTPASEPGDGLSSCTRDFTSFGTVRKGEPTEIDGTEAVELVVTDKADKGGKYTFHVATEGKPYILKVVYKGADLSTTTTYSGFDGPLDVRAPAAAQVLDSTDVDR
ncbi:putative lipoprotein (Precursor) [Streptomyces viridochromogenes Tue57]|uniref:Putative lipoprotein (Precursor) n=2 Tax=Streptomyces viridochromogenes TaxID=1938 RepID=L8PBS0_STRVR|nr:putative lipoprotein (Precursor) [Streptomyces viridochromogenes Tue57]